MICQLLKPPSGLRPSGRSPATDLFGAHLEGVTNHAIGEERIYGGIRICHGRPEIIAQSADRSAVLVVRFEDGQLSARVVGFAAEEGNWAGAQDCVE